MSTRIQRSLLNLDPWTFDQTSNGWRSLQGEDAVRAIEAYLSAYLRDGKWVEAPTGEKQLDPPIVFWHMGQLLACAGHTAAAIPWMQMSFSSGLDLEWDAYVLATIAFLERDKQAFDGHASGTNYNRPTLDRLVNNWGKTYNEAYSG